MIAGIDIGTQSLKAVVTDDELVVRGEAAVAYAPSFPHPGWAEQDPTVWESALAPALGRALAAAGAAAASVRALGICGQLDGSVPVDGAGAALAPCIIWMDRRATAEVADVPAQIVRERGGLVLDATHMAAKIRWQKRNLPQAAHARRFHQPVSWLVSRLTGEHVFDHGLASTTMVYDLGQRGFDEELLARFDIDAGELPAIAAAAPAAGVLTGAGARLCGLAAGIPVAVGTGDDFSNPLGAGVTRPGCVVATLGTAEVVGAVHELPVIDTDALLETHGYAGDHHFIENPGWLCGGALEWLVGCCRLRDVRELDALAADAPPGADGLLFLPALSGAMAPRWEAHARGCFYGLTPAHGTRHLARAVLEGCAFAMQDVVERLHALGVRTERVLALGGGARSRLWAGIRADLCGRVVDRALHADTSPLGAAVLAAVAGGVQPDLDSAAARVRTTVDRVQPDPRRHEVYAAAHQRYRRLFDALGPMYTAPPA